MVSTIHFTDQDLNQKLGPFLSGKLQGFFVFAAFASTKRHDLFNDLFTENNGKVKKTKILQKIYSKFHHNKGSENVSNKPDLAQNL